tara:strand:+ start:4038 stop:4253 length:216 start_codon:yes stop_codon:yes gene_type:complete
MQNVISIIEENVTKICVEINLIIENMSDCSKETDSCKIISLRNTITEYREIVEELELPMDVQSLVKKVNRI